MISGEKTKIQPQQGQSIGSSVMISQTPSSMASIPSVTVVPIVAGASGGLGSPFSTTRPVPMKLFSSWEVDRTPPNCIPRLCSLTLVRLVVIRPLPVSEGSSILIAVKMAGSRRTLRSNEIQLSVNGTTDAELELHFSLQYPHFLKREENKLVVMLQRRKKYKNRTILGYKTLAEGNIDMALVLQRSLDLELHLIPPEGGNKENLVPVGRVSIVGLSSQPVDEMEGERKTKQASGLRRQLSSPMNPPGEPTGKSRPGHEFSDEEDDFSSHSSDSPPDEVIVRKNSKSLPHNRNLKQKIVNLLRKFKATEERNVSKGEVVENVDIQELFDELEGLSDSEPDADTLSVGSFPKPALRPFFASSRSLLHQGGGEKQIPTSDEKADSDSWTEEQTDEWLTSPPLRKVLQSSSSVPVTPTPTNGGKCRISKLGSITDQCSILDDKFPDLVVFLWLDGPGSQIFNSLAKYGLKVLGIENEGDVRTAVQYLVGKLQKFCNNNSKTPPPITIVVAGLDTLLNWVTKTYVTQLSSKSHDWQSYFAFLYAPFTSGGTVWRLLCQGDSNYAQNFNDYTERGDSEDFALRLFSYTKVATDRRAVFHIPIAEAMITYKENQESSQVFVPFISDVRLSVGFSLASMDGDCGVELSSSPPSPPHSPREEPLELQVDYWKGTVKSSIKAFFRTLSIQRTQDNLLSVSYVLKEQKKQKIMRLGKKKEVDLKNKNLQGISRLVCLAKSHAPIKLYVDGSEWPGVKFFQVSSQWQSQVKALPLLMSQSGKDT